MKKEPFSPFLTQLFNVLRILHEHMDNLESTFLIFDEEPPSCVKQVPTEDYQNHSWGEKLPLFFFLLLRTSRKKSLYAKKHFHNRIVTEEVNLIRAPKKEKQSLGVMELFSLNFLLNCPIESFKVNFSIWYFAVLIRKSAEK